jgi:opacity protein-like surface antigen
MRSWLRMLLLLACLATPVAIAQAQQPSQLPYMPAIQATVLDDGAVTLASDPGFNLMPAGQRFSLRGWVDGGYIYNTDAPNSHFNGPYNSVYRSNDPMFNQAYLIAEFLLPQDGSFGVGGRIDGLWGLDYYLAQSRGLEKNPDGSPRWNHNLYYGVAVPQAYGEIGTIDHNVKIGHFYSIVGYESRRRRTSFTRKRTATSLPRLLPFGAPWPPAN